MMPWPNFQLRRPLVARSSVFNSHQEEGNDQGKVQCREVWVHHLFPSSLMHFGLTVTLIAEQGACVMYSGCLIHLLKSGVPRKGVSCKGVFPLTSWRLLLCSAGKVLGRGAREVGKKDSINTKILQWESLLGDCWFLGQCGNNITTTYIFWDHFLVFRLCVEHFPWCTTEHLLFVLSLHSFSSSGKTTWIFLLELSHPPVYVIFGHLFYSPLLHPIGDGYRNGRTHLVCVMGLYVYMYGIDSSFLVIYIQGGGEDRMSHRATRGLLLEVE